MNTRMKILFIELKRMLHNSGFFVAIIIGCFIACLQFYMRTWGTSIFDDGSLPYNVYIVWMGTDPIVMQGYWYYMILPLLAVLPLATTMYDDLKNGYINQVILRSKKSDYFIGKGTAVFISGGIICCIPLVLNFILTATMYPLLYPDQDIGIGPGTEDIGCQLYYEHPLIYNIIYMLFVFLVCGLYALSCMLISFSCNYKFVALLIPFAICYFCEHVLVLFDLEFVQMSSYLKSGYGITDISIPIFILICIVILTGGIAWRGKKYEA